MNTTSVIRTQSGWTVFSIYRDVDLAVVPNLRRELIQAVESGVHMAVDLSAVDLVDSSGFGLLIGLLRRLRQVDGRLVLVGLSDPVRRVFELTGLDRVFELVEDIERLPLRAVS